MDKDIIEKPPNKKMKPKISNVKRAKNSSDKIKANDKGDNTTNDKNGRGNRTP